MLVKLKFVYLKLIFFFVNDTATTDIYILSLHDALPICRCATCRTFRSPKMCPPRWQTCVLSSNRSEEHTSELQSRTDLVCRPLLEKKKRDSASRGVCPLISGARWSSCFASTD